MTDEIREFYDKVYAQKYLTKSFESDVMLCRRAQYTAYTIEMLKKDVPISRILDVGGADCKVAEYIKHRTGSEIVVLDISKTLLAKCKSQMNVLAYAQNMPFKSGSFDLVYSLQVLEHIPDWEKALEEIIRVSNSFIILSTDVCTSKTYHFEFDSVGHCHIFGLNELICVLYEKNLKILNICFPAISRKLWRLTQNEKLINWIESSKLSRILVNLYPRFKKGNLEALFVCKKL